MNENQSLSAFMKEFFGYDTFKGDQEQIIRHVISGGNAFVLMPTGGGKSLCYQLPALVLEGTAIVISPLIALMKNQVDAIRGFVSGNEGIAHFLNSSLNKAQIAAVREDLLSGQTKLLYVAPESLTKEENIALFEKHGVLGRNEIESRRDIAFENYCNVIHIEALTLIEMLKRDVMPAISKYEGRLWRIAEHKASSVYKNFETKTAEKLAEYNDKLFSLCDKLQEAVEETAAMKDLSRSALSYHDNVLSLMDEIRTLCDKAQEITKREYWPYPAYGDMLFHV